MCNELEMIEFDIKNVRTKKSTQWIMCWFCFLWKW